MTNQSVMFSASDIIDYCKSHWEQDKNDCSLFVKDIAGELGIELTGNANQIVNTIQSDGWEVLADGKKAKEYADTGKFVIGGLKGSDQAKPNTHGHVVVVVSGPLAFDMYPTAYWGKYHRAENDNYGRGDTVNYAWNREDRDKVIYAFRKMDA